MEKQDPLQTQNRHNGYFLSSLPAKEKAQYKRDAIAGQKGRHRKPNAALNLPLTRCIVLAHIPFDSG
ncbi:MAG: hypothetical protein EXS25_07605 [Pedosphaera sp.]|nr:hypothetical protein [Pedosphaera sp.]